jgi:hypothetical protein
MSDPDHNERKKAREASKIRARRAMRVTYDLPPELRQRMKDLAADQRLPASQLVTLALLRFLKAYDAGEAPLGRFKQPSRSPRYDWNLVFPNDLLAVLKKAREPRDENG